MSIASEITRLQTAKADLKAAIEAKGVTVSSEATLDAYPDLVDSIPSGGGNLQTKTVYSGYLSMPMVISPSAGYDGISSVQILPTPADFEGKELSNLRLFYIDETSDAEITFYDSSLNPIEIQIGDVPSFAKDNSKPDTKPKYYFYATISPFDESFDGLFTWTYKENGAFVYTSDYIDFTDGAEATNYFQAQFGDKTTEADYPFIWSNEFLFITQDDLYGLPFFIGSVNEMQLLKDFFDSNPSLNNPFTDNTIWTSTEAENSTDRRTLAYSFVNGIATQTDKATPGQIILMFRY